MLPLARTRAAHLSGEDEKLDGPGENPERVLRHARRNHEAPHSTAIVVQPFNSTLHEEQLFNGKPSAGKQIQHA